MDLVTVRRVVCLLALLTAPIARSAEVAVPPPQDLTELTLEELMELKIPTVYGASKFDQKTTEAPSSVTVIDSDEIKRYGYRTLADVLRSVQGLHVSYDRNYAFLGTRGINLGDFNGRILVLVDGHRVNNNLTDGALIGTGFVLDIDLIDRVEVVRGPGSVLYGNNAFFAVINVITRTADQVNGAEVSGEYGSYDTWKGRFSYGASLTNGFQLLLSGTVYDSEGRDRIFYEEFDTPGQNHGVARGLDDDGFESFFGSIAYGALSLQGAFIEREKGNPTAQYLTTFNDPRLRTVDERAYVNLKYDQKFQDFVDVTAQLYYDRNSFSVGYPTTIPPGTVLFKEESEGEWWGTELQLNKRVADRHVLTLGGEYRDDFRLKRDVYQAGGPTFGQWRADRESYGVFAQGDFAVLTNLHVNAGARYDKYGEFNSTINPRVAVIYHPVATSTLKAIYGTAFRAPNFLETTLSAPGQLEPEEITTYELVYEQAIGRNLRSSVSLFYNEMDDLIVFENGAFTNFNAVARGIELALEGKWKSGIRTRASYTIQETENRSRGREFADSPEQMVKLNLSVPVWKQKVFAGLEYQYTSSRDTFFTTDIGQTLAGRDASGFGILNLTLFSQELVRDLEFSASVYNIFDREYADPASRFHRQDLIAQNGRSFRLKVNYRF
jgi:outer membrane receptor for ferrienterochelin and colicins